MPHESTFIPKSSLADLGLNDGDVIEGRTHDDTVEIRVVLRADREPGDMTGERFVAKWLGKFPDIEPGTDPRLDALLKKHVK